MLSEHTFWDTNFPQSLTALIFCKMHHSNSLSNNQSPDHFNMEDHQDRKFISKERSEAALRVNGS